MTTVARIEARMGSAPIERVDGRRFVRVRLYGPEALHAAWRSARAGVALPPGVTLRWATVSPTASLSLGSP